MFLSSFLHKIGCYRRKTPILGAKLVKISHRRKRGTHFFNKKSYFISFSSPYPLSSPFVCHLPAPYLHWNLIGTSLEPHRNLIGTSSEPHRMMSVSSSSYQRYLFIILPLRSTVSRLACPDFPTPRLTLEYSARNSMSIIQRGPRKRSWRFGVLDECYSGIPCL